MLAQAIGRTDAGNIVRSLRLAIEDGCRDFGVVAQTGDSEFTVVLPGVSDLLIRARAAKLMQMSTAASGHTLHMLVGESQYPGDGDEAELLMAAADRRLFQARSRHVAAIAAAAIATPQPRWLQ